MKPKNALKLKFSRIDLIPKTPYVTFGDTLTSLEWLVILSLFHERTMNSKRKLQITRFPGKHLKVLRPKVDSRRTNQIVCVARAWMKCRKKSNNVSSVNSVVFGILTKSQVRKNISKWRVRNFEYFCFLISNFSTYSSSLKNISLTYVWKNDNCNSRFYLLLKRTKYSLAYNLYHY